MMFSILANLINADRLGGWVRGAVGVLLGILITKYPPLAAILTPELQLVVAGAIATVVVGIWSDLAKKLSEPTNIQVEKVTEKMEEKGILTPAVAAKIMANPDIVNTP